MLCHQKNISHKNYVAHLNYVEHKNLCCDSKINCVTPKRESPVDLICLLSHKKRNTSSQKIVLVAYKYMY